MRSPPPERLFADTILSIPKEPGFWNSPHCKRRPAQLIIHQKPSPSKTRCNVRPSWFDVRPMKEWGVMMVSSSSRSIGRCGLESQPVSLSYTTPNCLRHSESRPTRKLHDWLELEKLCGTA